MIDTSTLPELVDYSASIAGSCLGVSRLVEMGKENLIDPQIKNIESDLRKLQAALARLKESRAGKAETLDCDSCEEPQAVEGDGCQRCGHEQVREASA